jgi:hypothetical protein
MTVKDSSFSFFEVGIASNKIETERELGREEEPPKKIIEFLKDFSGGEERAHSLGFSGGKKIFSRQGRFQQILRGTSPQKRR